MTLIVKICGLSTRRRSMSRSMRAPTWSASFFFRRRPAISFRRRRHLGARARPRAKSCAHGRCRRRIPRRGGRSAAAGLASASRQGDAGASALKRRFGLPVMKAIAVETKGDLAAIAAYDEVADRLLFDARAPREATRPGGSANLSTGSFWKTSIPTFRSCCRAALMPATSPRRCASRAHRASMSPRASSAHPDRRTLKNPRLHSRRAKLQCLVHPAREKVRR